MGITSHAQNFEDVMLWRALGHINNGFYIDVGAQHPLFDSVSRAFYENHWRGIHVEALPNYAELLRQDRPEDLVLQVVLSNQAGTLTFYEIPETGLSTGDASIASKHQEKGFTVQEITLPCITLEEVFAAAGEREVHWLKIDVEGMEYQVLEGWGQAKVKPWIVVMESTLPNSQIENYAEWEALLLVRGYTFVFFDGLNRFYISDQQPQLATAFFTGPNIFDGFVLSENASFCSLLKQKYQAQVENAKAEKLALNNTLAELQQTHQQQIKSAQDLQAQYQELIHIKALDEQKNQFELAILQEKITQLELEKNYLNNMLLEKQNVTQLQKETLRLQQCLIASETEHKTILEKKITTLQTQLQDSECAAQQYQTLLHNRQEQLEQQVQELQQTLSAMQATFIWRVAKRMKNFFSWVPRSRRGMADI